MATSLINLADQLNTAIMPIIIVVGIVGNSLNIAVLTRPNLYKHACSQYFLALPVNNTCFSSVFMTYYYLAAAYNLDASQISITWCKLINFTNQLSALISPFFLALASIDRYCASSASPWKRRFSRVKIARWMILVITAILALFYVNVLIFSELRQDDGFGCRLRSDTTYKLAFVITQAVLFVIVAPFLMALFGILTIWNVHQARLVPVDASRYRRTESQLARMLLLQIAIQIILNLPNTIIYVMSFFPLPLLATPELYLAHIISMIALFSTYVTPFFLYILSAQAYKKELIHLVRRVLRFRHDIRVHAATKPNSCCCSRHKGLNAGNRNIKFTGLFKVESLWIDKVSVLRQCLTTSSEINYPNIFLSAHILSYSLALLKYVICNRNHPERTISRI